MASTVWDTLLSAEEEADRLKMEAKEKDAAAFAELKESLAKEREKKLAETTSRMKDKLDKEKAAAEQEAARLLSQTDAEVDKLRRDMEAKINKAVEYVIEEILR